MINGHSMVVKKPIGQIKMIKNHISPKGTPYTINQVLDYYSINTTNACNCAGGSVKKTFRIKGGSIPYEKAIVLK
jgi:hypothetical protein